MTLVIHEDVGRLKIAVQDALGMQVIEGLEAFVEPLKDLLRPCLAGSLEEGTPIDEFHPEAGGTLKNRDAVTGLAKPLNGDEARVLEFREDADLRLEHR